MKYFFKLDDANTVQGGPNPGKKTVKFTCPICPKSTFPDHMRQCSPQGVIKRLEVYLLYDNKTIQCDTFVHHDRPSLFSPIL